MSPRFLRCALVLLLFTLLQACGGGGGGGEGIAAGSGASVFGVAATGLAINGSVTIKDATGATRSASIAQPSGAFSIDVTGLNPPYFLKATDNTGTITLYSVATGTGNFNINPISNLVVVAAAMHINPLAKTPEAVFDNPANFANLTWAQIQAATTSVMAQMSPAFQAALAVNGASNVNPLTDPFQVGKGLDTVFDNYAVTLNTATGELQERQVASNTTTVLGLVDKLGTFPAAGVYDGTVMFPLTAGPHGHLARDILITPSGEMRYVMDNGVQVVATLTASGSTVTGTGNAYAPTQNGQPTDFQFADGSKTINMAINGTLGTGTLSGTYTYGSFSDTFTFFLNTQQTGNPSSLGRIAGTYASSSDSNTFFIGHIEANGKIWGSGPSIAYSGLIQVVDPGVNIYRVTLAYLKDGTYGYESGLATFYEVSPSGDSLPMPTALAPEGYAGELANLGYSRADGVAGLHGKLLLQLSSPLQQISLRTVRLSPQQQTIAVHPTPDSLMVQAVGNPAFSVTSAGDIQYSGSAAITMFSGSINSSAGVINVITNPGGIALNGPDRIAIPLTAPIASIISSSPSNLLVLQSQPNAAITWQSFTIGAASAVSFTQPPSGQVVLNNVAVSGNTITGLLNPTGILNTNAGIVTLTGGITTTGGNISTTGGSIATTGGTIAITGGNIATTGGTLAITGGNITTAGGTIAMTGANITTSGGTIATTGATIAATGGNVTTIGSPGVQ